MQELHLTAGWELEDGYLAPALSDPAALQCLPALHTLGLSDPSALPTLAPHLPPGITHLMLPRTHTAAPR